MSGEEHDRAIHAWAVLIAAYWTEHPPASGDSPDPREDRDDDRNDRND
jgi:hypothetical protein